MIRPKYILLLICLHLFAKQFLLAQKSQNISAESNDAIPQFNIPDSLLKIKSAPELQSMKSSLLKDYNIIPRLNIPQGNKETQDSLYLNRKYIRKVKHSADSLLKIYKTPAEFQKYYKNPGLQKLSPIQKQASDILNLYASKNIFPSKFRLSAIRQHIPNLNNNIKWLSLIPGDNKNLLSKGQKGQNTLARDTSILKDPEQLQSFIDRAAESKVSQLEEVKFLKLNKNSNNLLNGSPSLPGNSMNLSTVKNPLSAAPQFGKRYFQNYQQEIMNAQNSLDKLKQKYKYVPDADNLGNAVKNNQADENILKRLKYGCDFRLSLGNPSYGDLYPYLGYQLNKKFSLGISGIARVSANSPDTITLHSGISNYGYRGQAEYIFLKGFFMHGEYENIITKNVKSNNNELNKAIGRNINLGIGRNFTLYKGLKGNIKLLYNFRLNENRVYKNTWIIRFGFSN